MEEHAVPLRQPGQLVPTVLVAPPDNAGAQDMTALLHPNTVPLFAAGHALGGRGGGGGANARIHSEEEWAAMRDTITALYLKDRKKLREVMQIMESRYRFKATAQMYKNRFTKWGITKYNLRRRQASAETAASPDALVVAFPVQPSTPKEERRTVVIMSSIELEWTAYDPFNYRQSLDGDPLNMWLRSYDAYYSIRFGLDLLGRSEGLLAGLAIRKGFLAIEDALASQPPRALLWVILTTITVVSLLGRTELLRPLVQHTGRLARQSLGPAHPFSRIMAAMATAAGSAGDLGAVVDAMWAHPRLQEYMPAAQRDAKFQIVSLGNSFPRRDPVDTIADARVWMQRAIDDLGSGADADANAGPPSRLCHRPAGREPVVPRSSVVPLQRAVEAAAAAGRRSVGRDDGEGDGGGGSSSKNVKKGNTIPPPACSSFERILQMTDFYASDVLLTVVHEEPNIDSKTLWARAEQPIRDLIDGRPVATERDHVCLVEDMWLLAQILLWSGRADEGAKVYDDAMQQARLFLMDIPEHDAV